ncbi:MAG: ribbon-helix-helix domain-containing protein [Candidatus Natronoplasma sp.]
MKAHPVKIPEQMEEDLQKYMEELGYASFSEFARDAIRDKLYGRELTPEFKEKLKEGLKDIEEGNVYSHEEVKEKFSGSSE